MSSLVEKWGNMMKRFLVSMAVCLMLLGSGRGNAMSLNVQDGDVGELLRSVARMGNINIILDRTVPGNISLKVDEAEPEEILQQIIRAGGIEIGRAACRERVARYV